MTQDYPPRLLEDQLSSIGLLSSDHITFNKDLVLYILFYL